MKMTRDQAERFCSYLDSLTIFANETLRITDDLYDFDERYLRSDGRTKVNAVLWSDPAPLIDAYLTKNPNRLPEEALLEIASWKDALTGHFFLADIGPKYALLTRAERTFAVVGITQEIRELRIEAPNMVSTTLLPFEGLITYAMQFSTYPIDFGPGIRESMRQWRQDALTGPKITKASGFITASQEIAQEEQEQEEAHTEEELQREYNRTHGIALPCGEGLHRGALAGLTWEEREAVWQAHVDEYTPLATIEEAVAEGRKYTWEEACKHAFAQPPVSSLEELIGSQDDSIGSLLKDEFLKRMRGSEDESLERIADALEEKPAEFFVDIALTSAETYDTKSLTKDFDVMDDEGYELLEKLAHSDGILSFAEETFTDEVRWGILSAAPFARLFYHEDKLSVVLLAEYRSLFEKFDWKAEHIRRKKVKHATRTAEMMAFFCGIAEMEDVYWQFRTWYPDDDLWNDGSAFGQCLKSYDINHDIIETGFHCLGDNTNEYPLYVVSHEAFFQCGAYDNALTDNEVQENLDDLFDLLLRRHQTMRFSGLPNALKDMDPLDYCYTLPQVRRLCAFLDERVPDGRDDYDYADLVIERMVDDLVPGLDRPSELLKETLESGLVEFGTDEELREFIDCYTHLANALPCWYNNGTPPDALMGEKAGRKAFYDEFGRPMKVGRNDPCPCGSGKKYKKCCGR